MNSARPRFIQLGRHTGDAGGWTCAGGTGLLPRRDAGQMIHIRVLGLASIAADVSPQLALATIASVEVLGAFRAPAAVKAALAPRTA